MFKARGKFHRKFGEHIFYKYDTVATKEKANKIVAKLKRRRLPPLVRIVKYKDVYVIYKT